jgi:PAS domain S-box-containing protein
MKRESQTKRRSARAGLAVLISSRRDEITRRWTERVKRDLGLQISGLELEDSLPDFIVAVCDALRRGVRSRAPRPPPEPAAAAARHGEQRARMPIDLIQLIWEYGVLRDVVLDLAEEEALTVTLVEMRILTDSVEGGVAEAARSFAEARSAAEVKARTAEELLELGDAFLELDREGRILRMNHNQERLSQTPRGQAIGRSLWEVWPEAGRPDSPFWVEYHRAVEERTPREFDAYYAPLRLWSSVTAYPVSGGGMAVFIRDITERKRTEERLRQAQAFEQQLVAIASHDLRNPINAILLGAGALLAREGLSDRDAAAVARIRSSGERAARMIQDLLDLTRARLGGGIPVQPRPADLAAVARAVVDELGPAYPDREIRVEAAAPCRGSWDPDRLAQAIGNLVTNALKYGDPSRPVSVRIVCGQDARVQVHNEGEPIPDAARAGLFDPWERGARGVDPSGGSVGLGLFIVERIVAAHGGRVELDSAPGRGTTFTLVLPRAERAG